MLLSLSLLSAILLTGVEASNVLTLVPGNFSDVVGKGKSGFVEFYAPWCGHCKNLAPTWEELANAYSHVKDKVYISKVDADGEGREIGQKYGVKGFPTLKWFDGEGNEEKYEGQRDFEALAAFVTQKSGVKSNIKPPPPPATTILNTHTFDEVALDDSKNVFVSFTAPWCGHCKRMKPIFEQVAETFKSETDCIVANVDADAKANEPIALRYEIGSFPTLKFFPKGSKEPEDYDGGRTEEDFVKFLNEKCGTQRAVGGGLNDEAGRIPELDTLALKFFTAVGDAKNSIYQDALLIADKSGKAAQQYLKVMQKVVNGTEGYLEKESTRLASILKKRTLSPSKLDEIKIKANILAAFAEPKVEVVEEAERKHEEL